jgi:beta-phosphoglucomutase-like phosphatase (HAD superfamily)
MLDLAGLISVIDNYLDADAIRIDELRSRPAPDALLEACRRLDLEPEHVVTFTSSPAGVAAGHAAGLTVVGVEDDEDVRALLGHYGADRVVSSLTELLDRRLAAGA